MSEGDILKIFESIPQNETYSRYNTTLEKIFKSQSLRHFIENYKHKRAMSLDKNEQNEFTTNIFREDLIFKKMKEEENNIFDEVNEEKENENDEFKTEENKQDLFKKIIELKRNKVVQNLDPFKYHPNYNAIYKNIPSVKFIVPTRAKTLPNKKIEDKTEKDGRNKNIKKEKKQLDKLLLTEINTFSNKEKMKKTRDRNNKNKTFENINLTEKNDVKLPKLLPGQKNKINTLIPNKNNHALRFSKYLSRDFKIPENNKNISYINPFNYIIPRKKNKSIDFDKMLQRNVKTLIYASSLKVPSFGQYNPKYNWIDKDKNIRLFNPEDKGKEKNKKYLIKKICTSYNVNTEYQIVDNNMLNNK